MKQSLTDLQGSLTAKFYAKILLFGEYSVFIDPAALTIPFSRFTSFLAFPGKNDYIASDSQVLSNRILADYCSWLETAGKTGILKNLIDLDLFRSELEQGVFLASDIPQGYGLGSSGAFCAAVYDRYSVEKTGNDPATGQDKIIRLKEIFAGMERRFHGRSSGMDPLACYFGKPLLVLSGGLVRIADLPSLNNTGYLSVFLIDTGSPRNSGPLVNEFIRRSSSGTYSGLLRKTLVPAVKQCILSVLDADIESFYHGLELLSGFQYEHMKELIPEGYRSIWREGLLTGSFYIKLCGAGGGGFLLGFTADREKTEAILNERGVSPVFVEI